MIVIDTSVALKWALPEPGHAEALALLDLAETRIAPDLLLPEVAYVLRKKVLRGEVVRKQARETLVWIGSTVERLVPSSGLAVQALALSEKLDHSTYDCFFLATALGGGVLVTADAVFARKCEERGFSDFVCLLGAPAPTLLAKTAKLEALFAPQPATSAAPATLPPAPRPRSTPEADRDLK